jgi:hypothetical protein
VMVTLVNASSAALGTGRGTTGPTSNVRWMPLSISSLQFTAVKATHAVKMAFASDLSRGYTPPGMPSGSVMRSLRPTVSISSSGRMAPLASQTRQNCSGSPRY